VNASGVCAITGISGYVGSVLRAALGREMQVVGLSRRPAGNPADLQWEFCSDRDITPDLRSRKVDVLIHAAWDMHSSSLGQLRRVCVDGSRRLYRMAREAGVKRIVFISTISAFDGCRSAYGRSKLEVEQLTQAMGGIVLRAGLVFGPCSGGSFGVIRDQVRANSFVPVIGSGRAPQYLLHERTLGDIALRAATGEVDCFAGDPIVLAHPQAWPFRELVLKIAQAEHRKVTIVPTPWRLLYAGLRSAEALHVNLPIRSDSVISFVYQNPAPDFSKLCKCKIVPLPFV